MRKAFEGPDGDDPNAVYERMSLDFEIERIKMLIRGHSSGGFPEKY